MLDWIREAAHRVLGRLQGKKIVYVDLRSLWEDVSAREPGIDRARRIVRVEGPWLADPIADGAKFVVRVMWNEDDVDQIGKEFLVKLARFEQGHYTPVENLPW